MYKLHGLNELTYVCVQISVAVDLQQLTSKIRSKISSVSLIFNLSEAKTFSSVYCSQTLSVYMQPSPSMRGHISNPLKTTSRIAFINDYISVVEK